MTIKQSVQEMANRVDIFHYVSSKKDGEKDIFIDLSRILSFYIDTKLGKNSLVTKLPNDSRATYVFADEANLSRFEEKYLSYLEYRGTNQYLADTMLTEVVATIGDEIEKRTQEQVQEAVKALGVSFAKEIESFKVSVNQSTDRIIETALQHQEKINTENEKTISHTKEMFNQATSAISQFNDMKERLDIFVQAVDSIIPVNDKENKEKELNAASLNKETESV